MKFGRCGWWVLHAADVKERNTLPGLGFSSTDTGFDATAIGMVFLATIPNQQWNSATPESVVEEVERLTSEHLVNSRLPMGDAMMMAGDDKLPKTYVFKTPARTIGILQVTGFTADSRGVKLRYKLLRGAGESPDTLSEPKEAWSPAVPPEGFRDLHWIADEAKEAMRKGRYEEALQRHLWLHRHGREIDAGAGALRLSFWLADWIERGCRYPEARQVLVEIRDA